MNASPYTITSYSSPAEISTEVLQSTDLLQINGYVPGGIYHSKYVRWQLDFKNITTVEDLIGSSSSRVKHRKAVQIAHEHGYSMRSMPLTEELYEIFAKRFSETTLQKERAQDYHLETRVKERIGKSDLYIFGLFTPTGTLESGLIVEFRDKTAHMAFTAMQRNDLFPATTNGFLLDELFTISKSKNIAVIDQGRSLNPAGIVTSLGLFESKARFGFLPCPDGPWVTSYVLNFDNIALKDLLFVAVKDNRLAALLMTNTVTQDTNRFANDLTPMVEIVSAEQTQHDHRIAATQL